MRTDKEEKRVSRKTARKQVSSSSSRLPEDVPISENEDSEKLKQSEAKLDEEVEAEEPKQTLTESDESSKALDRKDWSSALRNNEELEAI